MKKEKPAPSIADDFIGRLQQIMIDLGNSAEAATLVAAELQREWGGERPYIRVHGEAARLERSRRDRAIVRDDARGESTNLIARRYGIHPRRVRQILSAARQIEQGKECKII